MQDVLNHEVRSLLSSNPQQAIELLAGRDITGDPEALFLRGVAYFRLKDYRSAESSFRGAIAADGMRADAFYYLGLALERRGVTADAVKAYRAALALDPHLTQAREKLGMLDASPVPAAPVRAAAPAQLPVQRRPVDSELTLADDEAEFADYERRKRRKAAIDARAEFEGQLTGMPAWAKILTVVFFALLLGVFAFVYFNLFTR
jgi:tetratricopeptide (TPR) repeat protein